MLSRKIPGIVWVILVVCMTTTVMAQTNPHTPIDQESISSVQIFWAITGPGSIEFPEWSKSFSYSSLSDTQVSGTLADYEAMPAGKILPSGNFGFYSVPEPTTIAILGLGSLVLLKLSQRRLPIYH